MRSDKPNKVVALAVILLGVLVMAASIIYLTTDAMIPGFIPFCSAILTILMMILWRKNEHGHIYAIIFLVASVLNLIAGILQVLSAI